MKKMKSTLKIKYKNWCLYLIWDKIEFKVHSFTREKKGVGDGQEGLACCGSWGHKELDTTEQLN